MIDDGAGRGHNLVGAAVVVAQDNALVLGIGSLERTEVGERRAAKLVDGLIIVGDDEEILVP